MVTAYFSKFYIVSHMKFVFLSLWHLWVTIQREQNYITWSYPAHKIKQEECSVSGTPHFKSFQWKLLHNSIFHPVALFIRLWKLQVVQTFEYVDEIPRCDHSNESYWAVLSCGTVYYAVQGGSNFWVCGWNPTVWPFKWKLLSITFLWYCLLCCTREFESESVDELPVLKIWAFQ